MQSPEWYGRFNFKNPGQMIDTQNKYIAIARLRQSRLSLQPCDMPDQMTFVDVSCLSHDSSNEETRDFSEFWNTTIIPDYEDPKRLNQSWLYVDSTRTGVRRTEGRLQ